MKRKTRYFVKIIIAGSDPTDKIYEQFSTIKNVRKFVKKYKRIEILHCWREVNYKSRGKTFARLDSYYAFDPTTTKGLSKLS